MTNYYNSSEKGNYEIVKFIAQFTETEFADVAILRKI